MLGETVARYSVQISPAAIPGSLGALSGDQFSVGRLLASGDCADLDQLQPLAPLIAYTVWQCIWHSRGPL